MPAAAAGVTPAQVDPAASASDADRGAALRLQASTVLGLPKSVADLIVTEKGGTDDTEKPSTTAELVEADSKALVSLQTKLDQRTKTAAHTASAAGTAEATSTAAVSRAQAAYAENGPSMKSAA